MRIASLRLAVEQKPKCRLDAVFAGGQPLLHLARDCHLIPRFARSLADDHIEFEGFSFRCVRLIRII
jgi:hypothetical protein